MEALWKPLRSTSLSAAVSLVDVTRRRALARVARDPEFRVCRRARKATRIALCECKPWPYAPRVSRRSGGALQPNLFLLASRSCRFRAPRRSKGCSAGDRSAPWAGPATRPRSQSRITPRGRNAKVAATPVSGRADGLSPTSRRCVMAEAGLFHRMGRAHYRARGEGVGGLC